MTLQKEMQWDHTSIFWTQLNLAFFILHVCVRIFMHTFLYVPPNILCTGFNVSLGNSLPVAALRIGECIQILRRKSVLIISQNEWCSTCTALKSHTDLWIWSNTLLKYCQQKPIQHLLCTENTVLLQIKVFNTEHTALYCSDLLGQGYKMIPARLEGINIFSAKVLIKWSSCLLRSDQ